MRLKKLLLFVTVFATSLVCANENFTGRVTRNKVRLRLNPSLDGPIIRQLDRGEMFVVVGEDEDYYAVRPPEGFKAYIYRPYVLDGMVEGSNVNVRLEPSVDAPIVAQLNTGDQINGKVAEGNKKWLEIEAPQAAKFYIAKDYIENVGGPSYLEEQQSRSKRVQDLLAESQQISEWELSRPFEEIDLNQAVENYQTIISDYEDFPKYVEKARRNLSELQEKYLQLKVEFLEGTTKYHAKDWESQNYQYQRKLDEKERELREIESRIEFAKQSGDQFFNNDWEGDGKDVNGKMTEWLPVEQEIYAAWAANHGGTLDDFYEDQEKEMVTLRGTIESYDRPVRNKPGNYILVNRHNQLPIAFLYSTKVNLQRTIGEEVTIEAVIRPNKNFAFPAYFVLSVD